MSQQQQAPAVVILGADAILAARPATPVQLANACVAAGYTAAVPASWGDELIAEATLKRLAARGDEALILCSCPRVAEKMRRIGSLRPNLLPFISPPVAAARYLRARAGLHGLHVTYIGDCPGAVDPAIDKYASPAALLKSLAKRGIIPTEQPTTMDERVARDGRRFYSLPGGVPAPNWVYAEGRGQAVTEPESVDYVAEIAYHVSKRHWCVIDLAARVGCACSGAVPGAPWAAAREAIAAQEPERAVHEVLDHGVQVDVAAMLEPWTGTATKGVPTLATPIAGLAALYRPESRAPAVREGPSSPVPLPRPSLPVRRVSGPTGGADGYGGRDRRRWDGIERRKAWVKGRPAGWSEPATAGPPGEPRTVPPRPQHTFIRVPSPALDRRRLLGLAVICSAFVALATSVLTVQLVRSNAPTTPARLAPVVIPPPAASSPASPQASPPAAPPPATSPDPAAPYVAPPIEALAPSGRTARSVALVTPPPARIDTMTVASAAPVHHKLRRRRPPAEPQHDSMTAAVVKPGAAPIPRASEPDPGLAVSVRPPRDTADSLRRTRTPNP